MKPKILIIVGSTREGRQGAQVARWLMQQLAEFDDAAFELVDLRDFVLPFIGSGQPPGLDGFAGAVEHWAAHVASADGFIIVTPEYNHGYPAALKNAIDHLRDEWRRKPVAFVSYGGHAAGYRATDQLRSVVVELQMMPIREQIGIQFPWTTFDEKGELQQDGAHAAVARMVDDLLWWTLVLKQARLADLALAS